MLNWEMIKLQIKPSIPYWTIYHWIKVAHIAKREDLIRKIKRECRKKGIERKFKKAYAVFKRRERQMREINEIEERREKEILEKLEKAAEPD